MDNRNQQNLAARIFKGVVFGIIGLGMLGANFLVEGKFYKEKVAETSVFTAFDYKLENKIPDKGVVRFAEVGAKPEMKVVAADEPQMLGATFVDKQYVFQLISGEIWGNFVVSDIDVNIIVDRVVLIPDHAAFDAGFVDGKLELAVYGGDVYVGFLPDGVAIENYTDEYSQIFMNRLLVTQGSKVTIGMEKVTDVIRPLLYSKLIKEFKYTQVGETKSDFVQKNLALDSQNRENLKQQFISNIIFRGAAANEGFFDSVLKWTQANLTFVPEKKQKILLARLFAYLDDAIFYANQGDKEKVQADLTDFDIYMANFNFGPTEMEDSKDFHHYFKEYTDGLKIFEPGDKHYEIEKFLLSKQFLARDDMKDVVDSLWQDVYEALDKDDVMARQAVDDYYNYLDKFLATMKLPDDQREFKLRFEIPYVAYQNQLFNNLLLRYPAFYQDNYFAIKNVLEKRFLDMYEGHEREELSQDFIDNKIDLLKRLRRFFLDGEIETEDTKKIFSRLIEEIDELMPKDNKDVAVIALFESQLEDIADFWGYLNSPQYQTNVYGTTQDQRYETYLTEKDRIWSFVNIQEDVLGEKVQKTSTVEQVVDEVKKQLLTFKDVSSVEVSEIKDAEERYVKVDMVIGGYPVKALYDRVTTLVKEVFAYDEEISKGGVKVELLLVVLQEKFADLSEDELVDKGEVTLETTAQRYARVYIAKILTEQGFVTDMKNVSLVDEEKAIYRVKEVVLIGYEAMVVTFDLDMKGEIVKNLFVMNVGEPLVVEGEFSLDVLKSFIEADGKIDKGEPLVESPGEGAEGSGEEVKPAKVPR